MCLSSTTDVIDFNNLTPAKKKKLKKMRADLKKRRAALRKTLKVLDKGLKRLDDKLT
jgi:hypothetical protein